VYQKKGRKVSITGKTKTNKQTKKNALLSDFLFVP